MNNKPAVVIHGKVGCIAWYGILIRTDQTKYIFELYTVQHNYMKDEWCREKDEKSTICVGKSLIREYWDLRGYHMTKRCVKLGFG